MEPKSLPPVKISPNKLLPSSSASSIVKKISTNSLVDSANTVSKPELGIVKKQVIQVKDLIATNTLLKKAEETRQRKVDEQKRFKEKEEKLEKPKETGSDKVKLPATPKLSFLDRIKRFLFNILLGFVVVRLIPHLPKLIGIVKLAGQALDLVVDWGGKLLNGLVSFIDWGYKAYEGTKKFLGNLGGENFTKVFDTFSGIVGKVIETTITAAIVIGSQGDGGILDIGTDMLKDRILGEGAKKAAQAGAQQTAAGAAGKAGGIGAGAAASIIAGAGLLASALGEGAFQVRKVAIKPIQNLESEFKKDKNPFTKIGRGVVLSMVRPLYGLFSTVGFLLDVVGAPFRYAIELLRYPFLSEKDKQKQANNLTKLDARIREDIRKALNMLTLGFAFKEKGSFGNIYGNKGAQKEMMSKMAGGGITRGGKFQSGVRRSVGSTKKGKYKRVLARKPSKTEFKTKDKKVKEVSENLDRTNYFGPILAVSSKIMENEKPTQKDYENVGLGLNLLVAKGVEDGQLKGGLVAAFAGGGVVDEEFLSAAEKGTNISNWVSETFRDLIESKVEKNLRLIKERLQKTTSLEGKDQFNEKGTILEGTTGGEYGPILDLIASVEAVGGYDVINGGKISGLSQMTISAARQAAMKSGGSGAMGRYQQMPQFVLGRAKSIGLNPDRDLFSPENQDKLAILLIDGAGYKKWKAGEMSTEKFAHNLSATWRGLPEGPNNLTYQDRYASGNKAHTTWANVMATLNAVKSGKIAGGDRGNFIGGGTGSGYGSGGVKIAGDLGDYLKANRGSIGITGSIHQHPRHPGQFRRSYPSYHNQNRALDIGGYGPNHPSSGGRDEQASVIRALLAWNKKNGYTPVQIIHGSPAFKGLGKYESAPNALHSNHVHVAYGRGGLVRGMTKALLGERGIEFVLDTDTTTALERNFPGFLSELNKANYDGAIQVLRNYASYEVGSPLEVVVDQPEPEIITVPLPIPQQGIISQSKGSGSDSSYDHSYKNG